MRYQVITSDGILLEPCTYYNSLEDAKNRIPALEIQFPVFKNNLSVLEVER